MSKQEIFTDYSQLKNFIKKHETRIALWRGKKITLSTENNHYKAVIE